jgi:UDP-3-O-[3-hydroxymyristoyl] N-acetylglucosamine deacetylase
MRPAEPNTGIRFLRRTPNGNVWIAARIGHVSGTTLATTLGRGEAVVHTVEHLLAALSGLRIDNLIVELDDAEIPIMDGSAQPFAAALGEAGIVPQAAARSVFVITQSFDVYDETGRISAAPAGRLEIHNTVEYDHPAIGRQVFEYIDEGASAFLFTLAGARTFGFLRDVERLKAAGLILGGTLDNAVVVGPEGVLNAEGLRWTDEFVRHKTLDLLGDLALLGGGLRGRLTAYKAGHALHSKFVAYLEAHPEVWTTRLAEVDEPVPAGL